MHIQTYIDARVELPFKLLVSRKWHCAHIIGPSILENALWLRQRVVMPAKQASNAKHRLYQF
jgi:hypothetical protein